ncbi:hypothetical protein YSA_05267 [Pseudomonas putida ND6]|uniref:Uncharacterized protein n=1 Tax=Pseudomonas putida ND6 TaxID=231023 RepID=I3UVV0_PSEPU|nr:hypothetical protein YSA_05267 [Pseudomonas putida ND6]
MIVDSWGRVRLVLLYRTFAGIVTVRFNNGFQQTVMPSVSRSAA